MSKEGVVIRTKKGYARKAYKIKPKIKYKEWTLVDWDGNLELGYKCYRKSFSRGYVSVGVGEFKLICYSHGHDSEYSMSSTRYRLSGIDLTEKQAMKIVDKNNGFYNYQNNDIL